MKQHAIEWITKSRTLWLLTLGLILFGACKKDNPPVVEEGDLVGIPYHPEQYQLKIPADFPSPDTAILKSITVDGVQLGRRLFYDPILSADSTQSCSTCHLPAGGFTDNKAVSIGIDGIAGRRSAMSLLNVLYATNGLFWNGRSPTLDDQALRPVEDPIEMHNTWANVVDKLKTHDSYPAYFRKAFGIKSKSQITKELAAQAIAQFERTMVSSGKSKYDRYRQGDPDALDDEELDGKLMFFDQGAAVGLPDAQCFHCHGDVLLTGNNYFNNGLDSVATLNDFVDKGKGEVSGNLYDNGKFRAPTLRNIALTAPYMHDGRFKTLEEVLDHYSSNGKGVINEDPFIRQVGPVIPGTNPVKHAGLTPYQKKAIIKFLHTLTDTDFINNPDFSNPYQ